MRLSELLDAIESLDVGTNDPEVYLRIGLHQEHVETVEYLPETDYEYDAVVIS